MPDAPAVLGAGSLPEYRAEQESAGSFAPHDLQDMEIQQQSRQVGKAVRGRFRSARDVYDYLVPHAAQEHFGPLNMQEYWELVTLMMAEQGLEVPEEGVSAANAGSVLLPGR